MKSFLQKYGLWILGAAVVYVLLSVIFSGARGCGAKADEPAPPIATCDISLADVQPEFDRMIKYFQERTGCPVYLSIETAQCQTSTTMAICLTIAATYRIESDDQKTFVFVYRKVHVCGLAGHQRDGIIWIPDERTIKILYENTVPGCIR